MSDYLLDKYKNEIESLKSQVAEKDDMLSFYKAEFENAKDTIKSLESRLSLAVEGLETAEGVIEMTTQGDEARAEIRSILAKVREGRG